MNHLRARGYFF